MRLPRTIVRLAVTALVAAACATHEPSSAKTTGTAASTAAIPPVAVEARADLGDGTHPGFRVPAFQATVRRPSPQGVAEQPFDSRATKSATLYVVNSTTCPYCAMYVDRMKALETKYMPLGVDVVHVYPNRAEPAAEKTAWHAKQAFLGGQILDSDAAIARALEADRTPTVYLVTDKGVIVYRGAIDETAQPREGVAPKPWTAAAIEAHLAGRPIAESETEPEG